MGVAVIWGVLLLAVIAFVLWRQRHKLDWHDGEVKTLAVPFHLGETRHVIYEVSAKNSRVLDRLMAKATLHCEEEVYYNQGTDRVRKTSELLEQRLDITRVPSDQQIIIETEVYVPSSMPASMDLRNNNIKWFLEVELDPNRGMSLKEKFDISVVPQIAGRGPESGHRTTRDTAVDASMPLPPTPRDEL